MQDKQRFFCMEALYVWRGKKSRVQTNQIFHYVLKNNYKNCICLQEIKKKA